MAGQLGLKTQLRVNPKKGVYQTNLALAVRDVNTRAGDYSTNGWWANVVGRDLVYRAHEPASFDGSSAFRPSRSSLYSKHLRTGMS